MKLLISRPALTLSLLAVLAACEPQDSTQSLTQAEPVPSATAEPQIARTAGECQTVFEGEICSWSESRGDELLAFGATVPMATVKNAPMVGEMAFPPVTWARVRMTPEVMAATGVDHLGVNWEVYGHPPKTFMTPHFDFHFYTMPGEEVDAIDCQDLTKPETLPEGYVLPDMYVEEMNVMLVGLCVPEMGMHAVNAADGQSEEFFDISMVVGYIYGNVHFIEPMIAHHHLMKRESFSATVPDMGARGDGLANPAAFEAIYDAGSDSYRLTFSMNSVD